MKSDIMQFLASIGIIILAIIFYGILFGDKVFVLCGAACFTFCLGVIAVIYDQLKHNK